MTYQTSAVKPGTEALSVRRRVLRISITTALSLAVFKGVMGWVSHSLVILASAVDSLLDAVSSTMNYLSVAASESPADDEHPYGHGKVEYLAGLFQSVVISGSAGFLVWQSVQRLLHHEPLQVIGWGLTTMGVSLVATLWLIHKLKRVIRQTGSVIMESEALHYTTDVWSNLGVAATLGLVWWTEKDLFDPLVAFAIAVYIFSGAGKIFLRSFQELMDRRLPDDVQATLGDLIIHHHPDILSFHELRTRQSGSQVYVDFHLVFRGNQPFRKVHDVTESLIAKVKGSLPGSHVTVHMDTEEGP